MEVSVPSSSGRERSLHILYSGFAATTACEVEEKSQDKGSKWNDGKTPCERKTPGVRKGHTEGGEGRGEGGKVEGVESPTDGTRDEYGSHSVEEHRDMAGEPMRDPDSAHHAEIIEEIVDPVTKAGKDGEKGEEECGPVGDVGGEQVIDIEASLGGEEKGDDEKEEDNDEYGEGSQWKPGRLVAKDKAVRDDFDKSKYAGDPSDDDQDKEEGGPDPRVVQLLEGSVK